MNSTDTFISPSILGLNVLLLIGLFFFIRASTKDRTEQALYGTDLTDVDLLEALKTYFSDRAYRVIAIDESSGKIALEGTVGASIFLAIFLGSLAAIGLFCLALVLSIAWPQGRYVPYGLLLLAPLASWFYWRGATRTEQVTFQIRPAANPVPKPTELMVTAHRDELAVMESQLSLKRKETE